MSGASQITNADVMAFFADNGIPRGFAYSIVLISLNKRLLQDEMPAKERLELLERLESHGDDSIWFKPEMIATVEPMCSKALQIVGEIMKLDTKQALDVYAKNFSTFAALNPSLLAALQMMPGTRARRSV